MNTLPIGSSIFFGVVSGVMASALLLLLGLLYQRVLLPWYEDRVYHGIMVGGTWRVEHMSNSNRRDITIELVQRANRLIGASIHVATGDNVAGDRVRRYSLEGEIRDRFVYLRGVHSDPARIGANSFLFEVIGDGQTMQGFSSAYSSVQCRVLGGPCTLTRRVSNYGPAPVASEGQQKLNVTNLVSSQSVSDAVEQ